MDIKISTEQPLKQKIQAAIVLIDSCLDEEDILGKGIIMPLNMAKTSLKIAEEDL